MQSGKLQPAYALDWEKSREHGSDLSCVEHDSGWGGFWPSFSSGREYRGHRTRPGMVERCGADPLPKRRESGQFALGPVLAMTRWDGVQSRNCFLDLLPDSHLRRGHHESAAVPSSR